LITKLLVTVIEPVLGERSSSQADRHLLATRRILSLGSAARFAVPSLAHAQVTNDLPFVDVVHRRPVAIVVALPGIEVVIDSDPV